MRGGGASGGITGALSSEDAQQPLVAAYCYEQARSKAGMKKAGILATAGRKATYYEATAPDGTRLVKRTFYIMDDKALIAAFLSEGKWIASAVVTEVQDWETQVFLPAKRIKAKRRAARE